MTDNTRASANVALTCFALFIFSVLAMPLLDGGYDPIDQTISEGALGTYGFVQVAGLLALAAGSFALAYCLRAQGRPPALQPTIALITFSAACVVAVAIFPTDAEGDPQTWIGRTHTAAATLAFVSNIAAMLWSARAFRDDQRLSSLAGMSLVVGGTSLLLLILLRAGIEPRGLTQRAAVACIQIWMILVALRLRTAAVANDQPLTTND